MAKWKKLSKADRYEPFIPVEERISRVRRRFGSGEHYQRRIAIFDRACARLNPRAIARLQRKHANLAEGFNVAGPAKYLDIVYWIWHKTELVERLNLDRSEPLSILDIGMGGGHFSFICEAYGHKTVGADIEYPIYEDLCETLGVERVTHRVVAGEALPDFGRKFDLVTALWIMFNQVNKKRAFYWSNEDWAFFLNDIEARLNPGGRVYLELNQHKTADGDLYWDEGFVDACEAASACVDRSQGRRITLDRAAITRFCGDRQVQAAE